MHDLFDAARVAELSLLKVLCLCAKVVEDRCNSEEGDDIHQYGSYVSSSFVLKEIERYFT